MALSAHGNHQVALLIGIEYLGTPNELLGCQRDVENIHRLLVQQLGFAPGNIIVLTESSRRPPTRANILQALGELVERCEAMGTRQAVVYYSGHGSQLLNRGGTDWGEDTESDGRDEVLIPLDYTRGVIRDDTIFSYLRRFPVSCLCLGIWDSCNSGTVADLPYRFRYDSATNTCVRVVNNTLEIPNTVVSISGCRDYQTSSVVYENNEWNSALTTAVIQTLGASHEHLTYYQLQKQLTDYMITHDLDQRPVVSCSWKARPGTLLLTMRD